jgi:hypothetical protein
VVFNEVGGWNARAPIGFRGGAARHISPSVAGSDSLGKRGRNLPQRFGEVSALYGSGRPPVPVRLHKPIQSAARSRWTSDQRGLTQGRISEGLRSCGPSLGAYSVVKDLLPCDGSRFAGDQIEFRLPLRRRSPVVRCVRAWPRDTVHTASVTGSPWRGTTPAGPQLAHRVRRQSKQENCAEARSLVS